MLHSTLRMSGTLVSGASDALPSPFRASMTKSNCATRPATVKQELRSSLPNSNWRNSEEWTGMTISPICYGYQAWYLKICKHLHIWSKMCHKLPHRCPCLEGIQADNSGILPSQHTPRPSHVVVVVLIRFVMFGLKLHQTPSARLQLGHNLECGTGIANEVVVFFPKTQSSLCKAAFHRRRKAWKHLRSPTTACETRIRLLTTEVDEDSGRKKPSK